MRQENVKNAAWFVKKCKLAQWNVANLDRNATCKILVNVHTRIWEDTNTLFLDTLISTADDSRLQ